MKKINNSHIPSNLIAIPCLLISAILLVAIYLAFFLDFYPEFHSYYDRQNSREQKPLVMKGRDFVPIGLVPTEFVGDGQRVTEYVNNQAMMVSPQYVEAEDFPFVRFDIEGVHRDMAVKLIWRRLDMEVGEYHEAYLHTSGDGMHWHNVAKYPEWRGTLVEIGLGGVGRSQDERFVLMRDEPFLLRTVELIPFSRLGVVKTVWDEWTYFEGWDHSSVNHYRGFPSGALLPPNPVAMVWFLVGASVFGVWLGVLKLRGGVVGEGVDDGLDDQLTTGVVSLNTGGVLLTMFMVCWLSQDVLRMQFRVKQGIDTYYLFAGYDLQEKSERSRLRCSLTRQDQYRKPPETRDEQFCKDGNPLPYF